MQHRNDPFMLGRTGWAPPTWTRLQDKLFERALVMFPEGFPDRWAKIAAQVPGKGPWEVRQHYEDLVYDVSEIDSGRIEVPFYADDSLSPDWVSDFRPGSGHISFGGSKSKSGESERKKGVPWTEEEHRHFLIGLQKYGRGDWRSISRNAVVTRTPTQVASHAQKYYLRLNSEKKEKKRSSIHDITTVPEAQLNERKSTDPLAGSTHRGQETMGPPDPVQGSFVGQYPGQGPYGYQHFGYRM
ncbi:transcription factor DIVARICATA-like [Tasmannia lanceolata]|uniref:transcription factor DIVARICATA-like n=1 Tax=Tasmannia lanceolata TaxID=3420 RepID=UPI0040645DFE